MNFQRNFILFSLFHFDIINFIFEFFKFHLYISKISRFWTKTEKKKAKQQHVKTRFKELDSLIKNANIPVDVGFVVLCREMTECYGVIAEKQGRYMIDYDLIPEKLGAYDVNNLYGKKRSGTLTKFYKVIYFHFNFIFLYETWDCCQ